MTGDDSTQDSMMVARVLFNDEQRAEKQSDDDKPTGRV